MNLLSIDVALGASISAAFFARVLDSPVRPQGLTVLALTVWIIYTADHLLDARLMSGRATSDRHRFHQEYFKRIFSFWIIAIMIAAGLVMFVRISIIEAGLVFGAFVLLYLLFSRWLKGMKEIMGTLLYAGGVLLPAMSVKLIPLNSLDWLIIITFGMIAYTNMLLFAAFSYSEDIRDGLSSFVTRMGERLTRIVLWLSFIVTIGFSLAVMWKGDWRNSLMLLSMELILLILWLLPKYFKPKDRFRLLGDAIFFLPLLGV